jgi:HEAT repeat protein
LGQGQDLDQMTAEAEFIFKGQALASDPITNAAFRIPQMKVHATRFKIISVLKGAAPTDSVGFQHYTTGPGAWSGPHWPANYQFEPGKAYLVFAASMDKPDNYYTGIPGGTNPPGVFRQLAGIPLRDDQGILRTLDARPLAGLSVKEAHWFELNLLLTNRVSSNALAAIRLLNLMSTNGARAWGHSDDFPRAAVLKALSPLFTAADDAVAVAAIQCFQAGTPGAAEIAPYLNELSRMASESPSVGRRVAALAAFSGTKFAAAGNSLPQWLRDPAAEVRVQAVLLLPDFPALAEPALRERAADDSPAVRAAVASAIGNGKIASLLPTLAQLLADGGGQGRPGTVGHPGQNELHASAARALLQFDVEQAGALLKANLGDAEFRAEYLCKLAERDAGLWLKDLAGVMESRRQQITQEVEASGVEPKKSYFEARMALAGTPYRCWNLIHGYLRELPKEDFAGGKLDRYLRVLEEAGTTGSREPEMIYELYRLKGMEESAARYRRACEATFSYDLGFAFQRADSHFTNAPAKVAREGK